MKASIKTLRLIIREELSRAIKRKKKIKSDEEIEEISDPDSNDEHSIVLQKKSTWPAPKENKI